MAHHEPEQVLDEMAQETGLAAKGIVAGIWNELRAHAPFTLAGAAAGIVVLVVMTQVHVSHDTSRMLFHIMHPAHVLLSAIVTTALFRLHGRHHWLSIVLVGFVGAVGIGTLSDCLIPFWGELLIGMEHAHAHIGFIEHWWLINPLALLGVAIAFKWPHTRIPHAGHVLLSTWASLFHMTMAAHGHLDTLTVVLVPVFLFLAVWVPCCASDIIFPLLFSGGKCSIHSCSHAHHGAEETEGEGAEV